MNSKDVIEIIEYAFKANTPLITIPVLLVFVFTGYCLAKKFFDTGYVTTSKEAREAQHQLIIELQQEIKRLNNRIAELSGEVNDFKKLTPPLHE